MHDFAVDLAKEIIETLEQAYPDQGLKKTQVYELIKRVREGGDMADRRGKRLTMMVRTPSFIRAVEADMDDNGRVSVKDLARRHEVSVSTIHACLKDDLGLVKKSQGGSQSS